MPALTLYRKDGSCSMVPHILLREIDVPFTDVPMRQGPEGYEGADGLLSRAAFLKLNPSGYVPTLVVDDATIVTEMPAVLMYIASLAPERAFMGATLFERVRVTEWVAWLMVTLQEYGFAGYWRPSRFLDGDTNAPKEVNEAIVAAGQKTILRCFRRIEERVGEDGFAVANRLTVVDLLLHTFWRWGCDGGFEMDEYPRYRRVAQGVERLNSVKAVMAAEGVPLQFLAE